MDMSRSRWWAGVFAACALTAAVVLPFAAQVRTPWTAEPPPAIAAGIRNLSTTAGELTAALGDYRATRALGTWQRAAARSDAPDSAIVQVDGSVPPALRDLARAVVLDQWTRLGPGASPAHAGVFVFVDSSVVPGAGELSASRRALEAGRRFDIWYALPEATDGRRCIALVRLRSAVAASLESLRSRPLLGPCGFHAAFGMPGLNVRRWLMATGYGAALRSDWDVPRAPASDGASIYVLGGTAARCLTVGGSTCITALRLDAGADSAPGSPAQGFDAGASVLDDERGSRPVPSRVAVGPDQTHLLADMVRDLGAARFARFWRSDLPPAQAFASTGSGIESWTREWLVRTYGSPPARAMPGFGTLAWLVVAIPCLVAGAGVRRREGVLVERLVRPNAAPRSLTPGV